ncbi:Fe-S-containing protein [Propionibacterium australiense]|uniref:DUF2318 domain-containing protein n=1 Tax=Propionibacterium australiense TaxID=119981 RepID=A0A383S5C3_9ACTN|nr:Fe-S-containing protein [Propionibacterium australiense]RLP11924.1 DUF2318 domain-containing protein [Propionibacterium australiense]RLP12562.1 DUF2318 domain-containing protein [Propionibacterium australiense]SYZ32614.1 Predicted membrane protein (DUF2318) [Propionibacterium australiense]VEH91635.1 Predicted membrane protein [Propionibacterium australiense]
MLAQLVDALGSLILVALTIGALAPSVRLACGGDPARPGPRPVAWGALAGAALGLAFIVVHQFSIIRFDRQRLTLTTLEPTVGLFVVLLALVWFLGRRTLGLLRGARGDSLAGAGVANPIPRPWRAVVSTAGSVWALAIVFRAGQSVYLQIWEWVPSNSTLFSSTTFLNVLGFLAGVAIAVVAGASVSLMCARRPSHAPALFTVSGLILTATHVFLIVRLLYSLRVIRVSKQTATTMSWLANHGDLFSFAAMAATAVAAVILLVSARRTPTESDVAPERRLKKAGVRSMTRRSVLSLGTLAVAAGVLTVGEHYATQEVELSDPEPFDVRDDNVVVGLDAISDAHLHRFEYQTSSGTRVRFIAIQKAGTSFGVGLDACEICGPSGYYEEDGQVICKLCGVAMNIATIGFKGGCNPIPIDYTIANGELSVPIQVLESSAGVFA